MMPTLTLVAELDAEDLRDLALEQDARRVVGVGDNYFIALLRAIGFESSCMTVVEKLTEEFASIAPVNNGDTDPPEAA